MKQITNTIIIALLVLSSLASCTSITVYDAKMKATAEPVDTIPVYSSLFLGLVEISEPDSVTKYCGGGKAAKVVIQQKWYNALLNVFPLTAIFWQTRHTSTYCPEA